MQIIDVQQGSPEWFEIKKLKMSASHAQAIGGNGKGLETYIYQLCADYLSSAEPEQFSNGDMERGIELEAQARFVYEMETGNEVKQVGFCQLDEYVGCSPDGFIGEDGLVEIKCPNDRLYLRRIVTGKIDPAYYWQMQMQLYVTDRKWCDYVVYNPHFEKRMLIERIEPDLEKIEKIKAGLEKGKQMIQEILDKYKGGKNDN